MKMRQRDLNAAKMRIGKMVMKGVAPASVPKTQPMRAKMAGKQMMAIRAKKAC